MKINFVLLTFLALAPVILWAQEPAQTPSKEPPVPPPGPLIARFASENAQWTATTQLLDPSSASTDPSQSPPPAGPTEPRQPPKVMTVIKTGDTRHVTFGSGNGQPNDDIWIKEDNFMIMRNGWKVPSLSPAGSSLDYVRVVNFNKTDFAGFEWISPKNFTGLKSVGGRMCLLFHSNLQSPGASMVETSQAAIDLKTRYPVTLQLDRALTTYVFGDPPSEKLFLPPEYESLLNNYKRRIQASSVVPARP